MNNKGFTMVELLVAMAIMGLLIIMAFPTIRAIQANNTDTKYEEYGKSAVSAAKLYVDSYGDDLFDSEMTSQVIEPIPLNKLAEKDLLKDINISGSTCINGSSVRVIRYNNDYAYCLNLHCSSGGKEVYTETNRKGSCKGIQDRIKTVTYKYKNSSTVYSYDVIIGDDNYKLLDPARMTDFKFGDNKETFKGWSLNPNPSASTVNYNKGSIYPNTINGDITFYAYTEKWKYTINYKKNSDGTYNGNMGSTTCTVGNDCPLSQINFSRVGYHFKHWQKDSSTTFSNQENVKTRIGDNVKYDEEQINLTAIFEINTCTATYSPNGGTFGNHANDVVQKVNYGNYYGDVTDGMRNANGGYYKATRSGYYIDAATAWSNGSKTFDERNRYLAQEVCDLSTNSNSTTLNVNWKQPKPTCTITAGRKADSNGWYNHDVKLTLNITGTATSKGIADTANQSNNLVSMNATKEGKITYYGYVANSGGSSTCSIKIKLDKTPPVYKKQDKDKDNTYNYWYIYYKDGLSGLTKVNGKNGKSEIYYCYGTSSDCSRQCKKSKHGENTWKGPDDYYFRFANIDVNFIKGETDSDWARMETYNTGCQNGKYVVKAWISVCDLAGNCEDCGSGGSCKKAKDSNKKERKFRKFTWDFR